LCKDNENAYLDFIETILLRYLTSSYNHRWYFCKRDYYHCFWYYIIIVTIVSVWIASCGISIPFYTSREALGSSIAAAPTSSESCQSRRDRVALLEGQISDLRSTDAIWMRRSITPQLNATFTKYNGQCPADKIVQINASLLSFAKPSASDHLAPLPRIYPSIYLFVLLSFLFQAYCN